MANVVRLPPKNDPERPNVIWAPSPEDRTAFVKLFANPVTIRQLGDGLLNAKIGEYAGLVHGNVQEVLLDGRIVDCDTGGLLSALHLYRGLKRPRIGPERDEDIFVYVTNPLHSYTYPEREKSDAPGPSRVARPANAVFTTYVEFGDAAVDRVRDALQISEREDIHGTVHFWEWTLCSETNPTLPRDHGTRYEERVW